MLYEGSQLCFGSLAKEIILDSFGKFAYSTSWYYYPSSDKLSLTVVEPERHVSIGWLLSKRFGPLACFGLDCSSYSLPLTTLMAIENRFGNESFV